MKIEIALSTDTVNNEDIILDKYFQFIVIGEQSSGYRKITIFTAASFHASKNSENANLTFRIFGDETRIKGEIKHEDCSHYYEQDKILQQFWGDSTKLFKTREEFSTYKKSLYPKAKPTTVDSLISKLTKLFSESENSKFLDINETKKNIKPITILPCPISVDNSDVNLKHNKSESGLDKFVSYGYWFKSELNVKLADSKKGFDLLIDTSCSKEVTSPDFKIYIQMPKEYDLYKNKVLFTNDNNIDNSSEIVRVYSQSEITYFKDWIKLGVYKSALMRVVSSSSNESFLNKGIKKIELELNVEDLKKSQMREIHFLLMSIIISIFCSIGFDATRLDSEKFTNMFPDILSLSSSFFWLMISIGLMLKYLCFRGSSIKYKYMTLPLLSFPIIYLLSYYLFLGPVNEVTWFDFITFAKDRPLSKDLILFDLGLSFYLLVVFLYRRWFYIEYDNSPPNKSKIKKCLNFLFGVE